jgi:hypothetical protein
VGAGRRRLLAGLPAAGSVHCFTCSAHLLRTHSQLGEERAPLVVAALLLNVDAPLQVQVGARATLAACVRAALVGGATAGA